MTVMENDVGGPELAGHAGRELEAVARHLADHRVVAPRAEVAERPVQTDSRQAANRFTVGPDRARVTFDKSWVAKGLDLDAEPEAPAR